jgi:hypothetical protein
MAENLRRFQIGSVMQDSTEQEDRGVSNGLIFENVMSLDFDEPTFDGFWCNIIQVLLSDNQSRDIPGPIKNSHAPSRLPRHPRVGLALRTEGRDKTY